MSLLKIRVVASPNPQTPGYVRLYSATRGIPSSKNNLYFTGDLDPVTPHRKTGEPAIDLQRALDATLEISRHQRWDSVILVSTVWDKPIIGADIIEYLAQLGHTLLIQYSGHSLIVSQEEDIPRASDISALAQGDIQWHCPPPLYWD